MVFSRDEPKRENIFPGLLFPCIVIDNIKAIRRASVFLQKFVLSRKTCSQVTGHQLALDTNEKTDRIGAIALVVVCLSPLVFFATF